jgi:hypothetical protein
MTTRGSSSVGHVLASAVPAGGIPTSVTLGAHADTGRESASRVPTGAASAAPDAAASSGSHVSGAVATSPDVTNLALSRRIAATGIPPSTSPPHRGSFSSSAGGKGATRASPPSAPGGTPPNVARPSRPNAQGGAVSSSWDGRRRSQLDRRAASLANVPPSTSPALARGARVAATSWALRGDHCKRRQVYGTLTASRCDRGRRPSDCCNACRFKTTAARHSLQPR